jgi:hypothetical protein
MEVAELKKIISEVQAKHPQLTQFGFGGKGEIRPEGVGLCIQWIFHHDGLDRRKTINTKIGSYGLKHAVERYYNRPYFNKQNLDGYNHTYIANGEFICAALYLGYKMKRSGPNAYFNLKTFKEKQ